MHFQDRPDAPPSPPWDGPEMGGAPDVSRQSTSTALDSTSAMRPPAGSVGARTGQPYRHVVLAESECAGEFPTGRRIYQYGRSGFAHRLAHNSARSIDLHRNPPNSANASVLVAQSWTGARPVASTLQDNRMTRPGDPLTDPEPILHVLGPIGSLERPTWPERSPSCHVVDRCQA